MTMQVFGGWASRTFDAFLHRCTMVPPSLASTFLSQPMAWQV
jgi:hypothetical protein